MAISIEDFEAYIRTMLDILDDRLAKSEDDIWKGFQTAKEALGKLPQELLCENCLEQIDCNKDALVALNVDATQLIDKLEQPQPDADRLQTQEKLAAIFNTQNVHSTRITCQEQKMDKTMHTLSSIPIHQKETVKIRAQIKDSLAKQGIAMQPTLCEALKHDVKIFQPKELFQNAPAKQEQASALSLQITNAGNEDTTGAKSPDSHVLKFSKDFDIKLKGFISAITQLTPTTVVTASFSPRMLSLVDISTRKVTSTLNLLGAPWGVTTVSYNQVAVTFPSIKTVQFVSVEETSPGTFTMRKTNEINMAVDCYGIDYRNDKLAVTYIKDFNQEQGHVLVMKMSGKVEYDISSNDSSKIKVDSVKFAPSGQELFVRCKDDAVRKISLTGDVLACYRDRNLHDPRGLAMMADGELLVCGYDNETIHVVGRDGVMRTVLTKEDGIERPLSLCLCEDMNKLCVGMKVEKVAVFEMFCEK